MSASVTGVTEKADVSLGETSPTIHQDVIQTANPSYSVETIKNLPDGFKEFIGGIADTHNAGVRRPYRGIEIKPESFASLSVVSHSTRKEDEEVSLYNSSVEKRVAFTSNFLINSVSENRQEKHQAVLTFGKDYVYFFGEQPRQITVNATLLNTANFRWEAEWWANYEENYRGTVLAASDNEACLRVDESLVYGFIISASTSKDSSNPHAVALTFVLHVTEVVSTKPSQIGSHLKPVDDGNLYGFVDLNIQDLAANRDHNAPKPALLKGPNANLERFPDNQPGALSRFINSAKSGLSSKSRSLLDFYYGRTIVVPAGAAFSNFSSGSEQVIEVRDRNVDGYPNGANYTGKYTDNFDEYPFSAKVFDEIDIEAGQLEDPIEAAAKEAAKFLSGEFGVPERKLISPKSAEGIPLIHPLLRGLSKIKVGGAEIRPLFAATNIALGSSAPITREQLVSTLSPLSGSTGDVLLSEGDQGNEAVIAANVIGPLAGPFVG